MPLKPWRQLFGVTPEKKKQWACASVARCLARSAKKEWVGNKQYTQRSTRAGRVNMIKRLDIVYYLQSNLKLIDQ